MANVAFIGLGVMGFPMAGHLTKAHKVTVYNRSPARAEAWVAKYGNTSAPTPAADPGSFVQIASQPPGPTVLPPPGGSPYVPPTLIPPGETEPLNDAHEIREQFEHALAAVVDAGACPSEPTTVIDLTPMGTGGDPEVVREGRGSLQALGL